MELLNTGDVGSGRSTLVSFTVVWLIAMGATIVSCLSVEDIAAHPNVAVSLSVVLSAIKVRLIFIYFMELKWSMQPIRLLFEVWTAAVALLLLAGIWMPTVLGFVRNAS